MIQSEKKALIKELDKVLNSLLSLRNSIKERVEREQIPADLGNSETVFVENGQSVTWVVSGDGKSKDKFFRTTSKDVV